MKKRNFIILSIVLALLINTMVISAVAISKHMNITVYPIDVKVDGEIFAPKDANGNDVPVFTYNGTTYAPLRALAEAYGLKVGYDAELNLATVDKQDTPTTNKPQDNIITTDPDIETSQPVYRDVRLLKVDNNYYTFYKNGFSYQYKTIGDLVFLNEDIGFNSPSEDIHYFQPRSMIIMMHCALAENYITEQSDNPFFRCIIGFTLKPGYEDYVKFYSMSDGDIFNNRIGIEDTIWYSPSSSYTPCWLEMNGYKLYNFNKHTAERISDRFYLQNGIRYYEGSPCLNDVFKAFGIDKEITFGEYEGFTYMEIK